MPIRTLALLLPIIMLGLTNPTANAPVSEKEWVDSVMASMSDDEKIGQLFMVAAYTNPKQLNKQQVLALVEELNIGGLIFMKGTPHRQVALNNLYQSKAKVPLLIATDAEWGLSMRLDSTIQFPRQLMLGAIPHDSLIYRFGREMAFQLSRVGVHMSFAPVVDVNNNPNNPVINDRSFGEDRDNVARKGLAYIRGLEDGGVLACAKHFPGHGDTDKDSHKTLPTIKHDRARLDSLELYPFRYVIDSGVASIMVAHLNIPSLDNADNTPTTLSKKVTTDLLKGELGYEGLIITDALNMKGVSETDGPAEVAVRALLAGNDILLFPGDVPGAIKGIKDAIEAKKISSEEVHARVRKILAAKYRAGLHSYEPVDPVNLISDLHHPNAKLLERQLVESAATLVANEDNLIPFHLLDTLSLASVAIGGKQDNVFQNRLAQYSSVDLHRVSRSSAKGDYDALRKELSDNDVVIVSLHGMSRYARKGFGIAGAAHDFIRKLQDSHKVILVVFGNPYSLKYFDHVKWLLQAYDESASAQDVAAQILFGGIIAQGRLPVTASKQFTYNTGLATPPPIRLKYTFPEEVGIRTEVLDAIDTIAFEAISEGATPGCQVLVARHGKVILQRSYGHHSYNTTTPVKNNSIYDLASITKIAATTLSVMRMYDLGLVDLNRKLSDYIPDLDTTNKKNLKVGEVMAHQAGLKDWIPFYLYTLTSEGYCDSNYCYAPTDNYSHVVADDLWIHDDYPSVIWEKIVTSKLKKPGNYKYSDLGFYVLQRIIEEANHETLDLYVADNFYSPLGMGTATFRPLERFSEKRIVPTEDDKIFRKQLVHGHVHDPGAAMMGGVAGHAGLFSTTNDLAILMEMLLNGGSYGGDQYFKPATIKMFTSSPFKKNRRGVGFDKPETDPDKISPTCSSASPGTFGHTGFTGTAVWADPKYDMIYVFLSNRVHPTADNRKLVSMDIRTLIQQVVYDAMSEPKQ